jgi:hypothetical protein
MGTFQKVFKGVIGRCIYIVLGVFITLIFYNSSGIINDYDNNFLIPDLSQVEGCIYYRIPETKIIAGQVCHLENRYVYLYLPDKEYVNHINLICAEIVEDYLERHYNSKRW